jgi:hypothetical protein
MCNNILVNYINCASICYSQFHSLTREQPIQINAKVKTSIQESYFYRQSDSRESHYLLEELKIELTMELFRRNNMCYV